MAPSARAWCRGEYRRPFGLDKTVLVSGPGLGAASTEVRTLAGQYGQATVLAGGSATTARVLAAIDGAGLAHIAAHGTFRADSPMFSSLRLDDGPMTVYDLERLRRAPFRLILPSCESGVLAPAGADELLGLATALLPLGGSRRRRPRRRAARRPRRRLPRRRRRPGSDRGRLVLHRPGRVITPSQGRSMSGDGAPSAEVVSSTSPAS